jgi:hypothetical protein
MAVPFYDNLEATPIDGLTCLVEVERVHGLDWDRFGACRALSKTFVALGT